MTAVCVVILINISIIISYVFNQLPGSLRTAL